MLQYHCVALSERSCDSSTGQEERANVESPIAAVRLQHAMIGLSNKILRDDKRFMVCFSSFPSERLKLDHFSCLIESDLRTVNDLRDLIADAGHSIVDGTHPLIDSMCGPKDFRSGHPSFLLRRLVQPLQRIFHIAPSDKPLPEPL